MPSPEKSTDNYESTLLKFKAFKLISIQKPHHNTDLSMNLLAAVDHANQAFMKANDVIVRKSDSDMDAISDSEADMNLLINNMVSAMRAYNTFKQVMIDGYTPEEDTQLKPYDTLDEALKILDSNAMKAYGSTKYHKAGVALKVLSSVLAIGYLALIAAAGIAIVAGLVFPPSFGLCLLIAGAVGGGIVLTAVGGEVLTSGILSTVGRTLMDLKLALHPFHNGETLESPRSLRGLFKRVVLCSPTEEATPIVKLPLASQSA